jgi:ATPase subunit of ABC transporter with duplicated ATPase domains
MLQLFNISKSYGIAPVLTKVSLGLNYGETAGLVGENGCGKTTLLRIIAGEETADSGSVTFTPIDCAVGYLAQALAFEPDDTVERALTRTHADHHHAWNEMQEIAQQMADPPPGVPPTDLTEAYAQAETRFEAAGGYQLENRLEAVLAGLGLADVPRQMPVAHLSGGQKTRLGLAGLLIRPPRLLLLEEPTNHLDGEALAWLETWLTQYEGAVLVVSHDRAFLDAVTRRTLLIDPKTHTLRDFPGNYSAAKAMLAHEIEQTWQAYQAQQGEIAQLRQSANHLRGLTTFRRGGKADSPDKFAKAFFANRSAATAGRAKQIERRIERLLTTEHIDKPTRQWSLRVPLAQDEGGARQVLQLQAVSMAFGPRRLFSGVRLTLTHGQRVVLTGPNGAGKTTLLRLIAGELSPTEGEIRVGAGVKLGYFAQEQEILQPDSSPFETIRGEAAGMDQTEVRNFLHFFLFSGDAVFTPVSALSYGERARLMLALLVARGCNFLLLDEPVNHLDIPSRERFEEALAQFPGTILAVSHDRAFCQRLATDIWELRDETVIANSQ